MRCFYHRDTDAIATCKSCGRGLCGECGNDVGNGLACRDRCEAEVRSLNRIIARNKTAYEKASGAYARMGAFYGIIGLVFLTGGILDWRGYAYVLFPAGVIFLFSAWLHFSTMRRYEKE